MNEDEIEGVARQAAISAAEADDSPPGCLTLSNGVILKIKPVPPLLIRRALMQLTKPEPPVVYLEEKGRNEPNPNDPHYLEALSDWAEAQNTAALNVMLLCGTTIVTLPDGFAGPDSDEWVEQLETLGIVANLGSKSARYLVWLQTVACETPEDLSLIGASVGRASGLMELDVSRAVDSFRGGEIRGIPDEPDVPEGDYDRSEPSPAYSGNGSGV